MTRTRGTRRRPDGERGAGLIGTVAGLTVFLALLTVTLQLLLRLAASSTVQAAAYEAARQVAVADTPPDDGVRAAAEDDARVVLGGLGATATFEWDTSDPAVVELRVTAESPQVLAPVLDAAFGQAPIERVVRVRREQLQP